MTTRRYAMSDDSRELTIWVASTERELRRAYCIDFRDVGFSQEEILHYWEMEFSPQEFVEWLGQKYDLIEFNGPDIFFRHETKN